MVASPTTKDENRLSRGLWTPCGTLVVGLGGPTYAVKGGYFLGNDSREVRNDSGGGSFEQRV